MLLHCCCFPEIREIAAAGNAFSSSSLPPPPVIDSIFLVLVPFPVSAARHNYRRRKEERGKRRRKLPFSVWKVLYYYSFFPFLFFEGNFLQVQQPKVGSTTMHEMRWTIEKNTFSSLAFLPFSPPAGKLKCLPDICGGEEEPRQKTVELLFRGVLLLLYTYPINKK